MPNGKPGDHPLTDMLVHGMHPFPRDIERMLRQLHRLDPKLVMSEEFIASREYFDWEKRKNLEVGRAKLKLLLGRCR